MFIARKLCFSLQHKKLNDNNNILFREFAVVGRHSKNVAGKKNKLDAQKQKIFNRLAIKILMVRS